MTSKNNTIFRVNNDWGKLREVMVGIVDETMEPEWHSALRFLSPKAQEYSKKIRWAKNN